MKLFIFILTCSMIFATSAIGQKPKKAFKYANDTEDLRKDSFPDMVTFPKVGRNDNTFAIEAVDKSFVLKPNEQFVPKFYTNGYVNPTKDGMTKKFKNSKGTKVRIKYNFEVPNPEYKPDDEIAKNLPKTKKETGDMYGLIEFNKVWDECSALPNTRAYYINLTKDQIDAAKGGKVNVVWELYSCSVPFPNEKPKANTFTSFVLWLSDVEF